MMNDSNHTVAVVAENYLCCSCGACQVVCPVNAIILKETPGGYIFPIVNHDLCTDCGACQGSCAGIRLASDLPEDPFTGPVLGCWVGRSTDDEIFRKSQSRGAVTAILESLLADKKIDGAATVVMESGNPPRPLVRIARTREDLLSAQGSKYSPVPLLTFLENPKSNGKPLAAVALACHVHGLHNVFEAFPTFRKMVGPVIGLVCDRVMTCQAIDYILWRSKMKENDPVSLEFRSKEWRGYPGDVRVRDVKGHVTNLSRKQRTEIKDYFTPPRCRLCFDKMNVLADITVGDPWGIPGADKTRGESVVIARTPRELETVRKAIEKEQILLREVPYELVLEGQSIEQKKREFAGYCSSWASMQRPLPEQAKRVLGIVGTVEREDHYSKNLRHSLSLDQFPSSVAIARDARKWVINRKIIKKINKILNHLTLLHANGQMASPILDRVSNP